jgi:hypothetical protein
MTPVATREALESLARPLAGRALLGRGGLMAGAALGALGLSAWLARLSSCSSRSGCSLPGWERGRLRDSWPGGGAASGRPTRLRRGGPGARAPGSLAPGAGRPARPSGTGHE